MTRPLPKAAEGAPTSFDAKDYVIGQLITQSKLDRAVRLIFLEANNRTCATCENFRVNWCAKQVNLNGEPLTIFYQNAPACNGHEPVHNAV